MSMPPPRSPDDPATVIDRLTSRTVDEDVPTFEVVVTEGRSRGRRVSVHPNSARVLVGQSSASDLALEDARVSRRHLALEAHRRGLRIVDLDSTNGTTINGLSVETAYARPGDVLRLGDSALTVQGGAPAQPPEAFADEVRFGRLLGASPRMRKLYPICARLAASNVSVILEGETGSGKELLAEALHEASPRAKGPFVVFDCTAVAPNLIESALMGHEKGAFTTAIAARRGAFEQAHGGTLLIDEIGDLDLSLQPKLLRILEQGAVQRVGGDRPIPVDVRVLAATRRDLEREIQDGRFRDDLFYRLAVARIELPPLRERREDIGLLARSFWRKLGDAAAPTPIPQTLLERFERHAWPGNVRELRNAVARHLALGELAPELTPEAGASAGSGPRGAPGAAGVGSAGDLVESVLALDLPLQRARERIVQDFERRYVERVLARHNGNVTRAAAASGIARRSFYAVLARGER